ncbi:alcohol dehydrogenase 2 [Fusarium phyllophilum]|uniref:Alcohol dehydrogenase 2 n=1 Tax=Fusarium phyllophilum TaxID=47803 RepID=A0A8H5JXC5_9HYPO|nr:alcohol dehydrogenase 2 [Fusarium phyllophilum]
MSEQNNKNNGEEPNAVEVELLAVEEDDNFQAPSILSGCFAQVLAIVATGAFATNMANVLGGRDKYIWIPQGLSICSTFTAAPIAQSSDFWGRKLPILICTGLCIIGSLIISRAHSMTMAIAGSLVFGVGAGTTSLLYAVPSEIMPRQYRPIAQAGVNIANSFGGIFTLLLGFGLVRKNDENFRVVCPYSWQSAPVLSTFVIGIVFIIITVVWEVKKKGGFCHHGLFQTSRNFALALVFIFIEGFSFYAANNFLPLAYSVYFDSDLLKVGAMMSLIFIGGAISSVIGGLYSTKARRVRPPLMAGMVLFVTYFACMATLKPGQLAEMWGYTVLAGFGLGFGLVIAVTTGQMSTPPGLIATTSGLTLTSRSLGGSVALPVYTAILNSSLSKHLGQKIAERVVPLGLSANDLPAFVSSLANNDQRALAAIPGVTPQVISAGVVGLRSAYHIAFRGTWSAAAAVSAVGLILALFVHDPRDSFNMHVDAPVEGDIVRELDQRLEDGSKSVTGAEHIESNMLETCSIFQSVKIYQFRFYPNPEPWITPINAVSEATAGSAVVQVLNTVIFPYAEDIHQGKLPVFNLSLPLVPHPSHIGRTHAVGSDAILAKPGDLVFFSAAIYARDDPSVNIIQGHHGGEGTKRRKLMQGEWRDGALQQYQKVPLENIFVLDENKLCKQLGYTPADLHEISFYSISAGALFEAANLLAGETIVLGPATGTYGGITSEMGLALGANVVAIGRSETKLAYLKQQPENHERFSYVVMTGDDEVDAAATRKAIPDGRGVEVYNDWASGSLNGSPYFSAAIQAVLPEGRVVLSGAPSGSISVPYTLVMHKNINIIGKVMVSRGGVELTIKMVNSGVLKLGKRGGSSHKVYGLEEHHEAFEDARQNSGFRVYTDVAPNSW